MASTGARRGLSVTYFFDAFANLNLSLELMSESQGGSRYSGAAQGQDPEAPSDFAPGVEHSRSLKHGPRELASKVVRGAWACGRFSGTSPGLPDVKTQDPES